MGSSLFCICKELLFVSKHRSEKKHRSRELMEMAEEIARTGSTYASLAYALENRYLCMGRLHGESFLEQHFGWVLSLNRTSALISLVHGLEPAGNAWVRLSAISMVQPEPQLTEQWRLLGHDIPDPVSDGEADLQGFLTGLADHEILAQYLSVGASEQDTTRLTGRIVKLGKKRLAVRELDAYELAWHPEPVKLPYESLDLILFDTPLLRAREKLSMSYDAYIRSLNESVDLPSGVEDMEDGEDVRETESEDMVDLEDLAAMDLLDGAVPEDEL